MSRDPADAATAYEAACRLVCNTLGLERDALLTGTTKGRSGHVFARRMAMYVMVMSGIAVRHTASQFKRCPATVTAACAAVEEARDDPRIDDRLDRLELAMTTALSRRGA